MGNNTFVQHLLKVLLLFPAGLSEFELIQKLETDGQPGFETDCLKGNLSLFQTHFFLFHSLYLLREQLRKQFDLNHKQQYQLEISPLCI
ncbi:MAG: DNA-J related domain-containing protein, partial [Gammaproteobacteria bacterium]